ncbi:hypothetical protein D3C87_2191960 [compost metagenome]
MAIAPDEKLPSLEALMGMILALVATPVASSVEAPAMMPATWVPWPWVSSTSVEPSAEL